MVEHSPLPGDSLPFSFCCSYSTFKLTLNVQLKSNYLTEIDKVSSGGSSTTVIVVVVVVVILVLVLGVVAVIVIKKRGLVSRTETRYHGYLCYGENYDF